jgi:membrane dipeptidase
MSLWTVFPLCCALGLGGLAQTRPVSDAEVERVHRSALLIDTHNDITSRTVEGYDIGKRQTATHTDVPRLREGGVGAVIFAVYVSSSYARDKTAAHRTLAMIDTVRHDIIARNPGDFALATDAAGIEAARRQGKIAALLGIEGGHAIEDDLRLLRGFHALGIRYMTLTHSNTNNWADSSGDLADASVKHHNGLNALGREVIAEMNRLGMLVDISHVSDKTFYDALEASKAPIFASHSSCRSLANIPRNMTDEMIQALAKKGGVVQINFGCEFLSQKSADSSPFGNPALVERFRRRVEGINDPAARRAALRKAMEEAEVKTVRATIDDVVAQIDHVRKIAGIDAVGIGSDFDGVSCTPAGLDDVSKFPNLTRKLLERGYTPEDIRKVYGGNFLRVLRAAEKTALALR